MRLFLTVCLEVRYILKMVERALQAIGLGSQMEFVCLILTVMKRHKATGITSNFLSQRIFSCCWDKTKKEESRRYCCHSSWL